MGAREIVNSLVDTPKTIRQGKIKSVSTAKYDCEIEDGEETIKNVPLQVLRRSTGTGFIVVPKVGTQCLYGFLMDGRVTLIQCDDFDDFIAVTGDKNGIKIDANTVKLGAVDTASHDAAYGDAIETLLLQWHGVMINTFPALQVPTNLKSSVVKIS